MPRDLSPSEHSLPDSPTSPPPSRPLPPEVLAPRRQASRRLIDAFFLAALVLTLALWLAGRASAQEQPPAAGQEEQSEEPRTRNPNQMRLRSADAAEAGARRGGGRQGQGAARFPDETRTIDGSGNNAANPDWGRAGIAFVRLVPDAYAGDGDPSGAQLRSAREVSNLCVADDGGDATAPPISDFFWQWGQFLDHDLDLTPEVEPVESFDIPIPTGDPWFDPGGTGDQEMHFGRSAYVVAAGVREQVNAITAYVDASNVYGSDAERAAALRTLDGTGKLETSVGNLLPFNDAGLPNAGGTGNALFLAGDFRANEQVGLTAMHTLFVREHNWIVDNILQTEGMTGDQIYEAARALVAAEMQAITYREFLPLLLGADALPPYRGYDADVDVSITNEFATAAYRFGHSMVSPTLLRLDASGNEIADGHLTLDQAFFRPDHIVRGGIEPLLRGLAAQRAQRLDNVLIDELRNLLFGPPGSGGLDLASLNIQRGRDHGFPGYGAVRAALGLEQRTRFRDVGRDRETSLGLVAAYRTVDEIDLWVGGLAEAPEGDGLVGETFHAILVDQFVRLRDGDRFWYESYLPRNLRDWVNQQSLGRIIRRVTRVGQELPLDVFRLPPAGGGGRGGN